MRAAFATTVVVFLGGCGTMSVSNLGEPPTVNTNAISLIDNRSAEQRAPRRDSALAPLSVLGDANVQPPAMLFLQSSLQNLVDEGAIAPETMNDVMVNYR